mgnify:CR=1 FL=1
MQNHRLLVLVEGAIIVAFAMALNYIPHTVGVSAIEVQFGLIPFGVYAMRRGLMPTLAAGLVWGLLDMFLRGIPGGSVLNATQGIIEYPIAFTVVGLGGIIAASFQHNLKRGRKGTASVVLVGSIIIAGVAKYFFHFIAGIIFWGSYAPKGQPVWLYSLIVNGGSALVSILLASIVLVIVLQIAPRLFTPER